MLALELRLIVELVNWLTEVPRLSLPGGQARISQFADSTILHFWEGYAF